MLDIGSNIDTNINNCFNFPKHVFHQSIFNVTFRSWKSNGNNVNILNITFPYIRTANFLKMNALFLVSSTDKERVYGVSNCNSCTLIWMLT